MSAALLMKCMICVAAPSARRYAAREDAKDALYTRAIADVARMAMLLLLYCACVYARDAARVMRSSGASALTRRTRVARYARRYAAKAYAYAIRCCRVAAAFDAPMFMRCAYVLRARADVALGSGARFIAIVCFMLLRYARWLAFIAAAVATLRFFHHAAIFAMP